MLITTCFLFFSRIISSVYCTSRIQEHKLCTNYKDIMNKMKLYSWARKLNAECFLVATRGLSDSEWYKVIGKKSMAVTAPSIPTRWPIQVLTGLHVAWLRWSDENRSIQRGMAVSRKGLVKVNLNVGVGYFIENRIRVSRRHWMGMVSFYCINRH